MGKNTYTRTESYQHLNLGYHYACGGEVLLFIAPVGGFRFCNKCMGRGASVQLRSEVPLRNESDSYDYRSYGAAVLRKMGDSRVHEAPTLSELTAVTDSSC